MNRQAVIDLLGTPSSSEKIHSRETLKYSNLGLKVVTEALYGYSYYSYW